MRPPRFCQGAALIAWGVAVNMLMYALPMALLLELQHFVRRRWDLERTELYRIADLTTVVFVGLTIYLATAYPLSHLIVSLVRYTPFVFYPLVLALAFSTWERLPLDVLFYSLRGHPEEQSQWDIEHIYVGVCLVAMGTNAHAGLLYLPTCVAVICWSLWPGRPQRYPLSLTLLVIVAMLGGATATHLALHRAHLLITEKTTAWLTDLMNSRMDPLRTSTALGSVGRLELSSAIVMRIVRPRRNDRLLYLQEASYDWYLDKEWMVMQRSVRSLEKTDQFSWRMPEAGAAGNAPGRTLRIYQDFDDDQGLVPLPPGALAIKNYPAVELMENHYGSVQATGILSAPAFEVEFTGTPLPGEEPGAPDTRVPEPLRPLIETQIREVVPPNTPPREAVRRIEDYFATFHYTLYQPEAITGREPLAYFLRQRHAGHCEFFATATVLLLRQAGVPARYAVGYVVQEFDSFTGMYLVRRSHAHAWAVAYLDGAWRIVDTTPSTWIDMEEDAMSPARPVADFLSNLLFRFRLWQQTQRLEDYTAWLYGLVVVLTLFLIYRLSHARQVLLEGPKDTATAQDAQRKSAYPFYRIEQALHEAGHSRLPGEPMLPWVARIGRGELRPLVEEHYASRFDPAAGMSAERQDALRVEVERWLAEFRVMKSVAPPDHR